MSATTKTTSRSARRYHGLGGTPTYRSWYSMIDRCSSAKNASWKHYGGRGITVCERWLDLENFVADMGLRPDGCSIDRIDPNGNYEPTNCRWATEAEQQRNRRGLKCCPDMARAIRNKAASGVSQYQIAAAVGMHQSSVSRIVSGSIWSGT